MKKLITPALVAFLATTFVSCQKESIESQPLSQSTAKNQVNSSRMNIISHWLTLSFSPVESTPTTRNIVHLAADYIIPSPVSYNANDYVQLAYVKIPARNNFTYQQLPGLCYAAGQNLEMQFSVDQVSFKVKIWNANDYSQMPFALGLETCSFRYLLIPREVYQSMSINWNDYIVVAAALNLSL